MIIRETKKKSLLTILTQVMYSLFKMHLNYGVREKKNFCWAIINRDVKKKKIIIAFELL